MTRILFVCLGNICRSPLAEGLFLQKLKAVGREGDFVVDSAGTGNYHVGELADERTRRNAEKHGVTLTHRARQFAAADYDRFDRILVMDHENLTNVLARARTEADKEKVELMRTYDPEPDSDQVPDPWFGGEEGFEQVFNILDRSTGQFLKVLSVE